MLSEGWGVNGKHYRSKSLLQYRWTGQLSSTRKEITVNVKCEIRTDEEEKPAREENNDQWPPPNWLHPSPSQQWGKLAPVKRVTLLVGVEGWSTMQPGGYEFLKKYIGCVSCRYLAIRLVGNYVVLDHLELSWTAVHVKNTFPAMFKHAITL